MPKSRKVEVKKVIDGDTFETTKGEFVRLSGVDTPEKGQRGAKAATDRLKKIEGKEVTITPEAKGHYGRTIAKVKIGRSSVNKSVKEKKVIKP